MYNKLLDTLRENGFIYENIENEEMYLSYNEDCLYVDDLMRDFFLQEGITSFDVDLTYAGDGRSVLSIAWSDNEGLHLETFLLEG